MGADDYLTKPFSPRELIASLKAIFRRTHLSAPVVESTPIDSVTVRNVQLWPARRVVELNGQELSLTGMEFDILSILMERGGLVVTRDAMMNALKGEDWDVYDRSVDVHISHLRKKIGLAKFIKTIRGVGYVVTP